MMIEWFRQNYPDCPPLAFIMRQRFPWRWFRIHSLPESKRYPESDFDENIVLSRHNQVATDLLGENAKCVLVVTQYDSEQLDFPYLSSVPDFTPVYRYYTEDDAEPWVSWATLIDWVPHRCDNLILAIANDETANTLFTSPSTCGIYAPYDGGADLFHVDPVQINAITARYQEWTSKHPEGL